MDKNDIKIWIGEALFREGLTDKSYSHKPHLAGLPYDRRSRNFDELRERYEACRREEDKRLEKMRELKSVMSNQLDDYNKYKSDLEESVEKLKGYNEDNQKFFDADDKLKNEKIEKAKELEKEFENIFENMEDVLDGLSKKESDVFNELDRISGLFLVNGSSILPKGDVDDVLKLADDYVDVLDHSGIHFDKEQYALADSLRDLTKNSDSILKLQDNAHTVGEISGLQDHINTVEHSVNVLDESIKRNKKELDKNTREWLDFRNEGGKVSNLCYDLGFI